MPRAPRAHDLVTALGTSGNNSDRPRVVGRDTQPEGKGEQRGHRPLGQRPLSKVRPSGTKPDPDRAKGRTTGGEAAGRTQSGSKEGRGTAHRVRQAEGGEEERQ